MYCHNCGQQIVFSAKYCPFCGTKLEMPQKDLVAEKAEPLSTLGEPIEEIQVSKPKAIQPQVSTTHTYKIGGFDIYLKEQSGRYWVEDREGCRLSGDYEYISLRMNARYFVARKNGKYGFLRLVSYGRVVEYIPCLFEKIDSDIIIDDKIKVCYRNSKYTLNLSNKWLYQKENLSDAIDVAWISVLSAFCVICIMGLIYGVLLCFTDIEPLNLSKKEFYSILSGILTIVFICTIFIRLGRDEEKCINISNLKG